MAWTVSTSDLTPLPAGRAESSAEVIDVSDYDSQSQPQPSGTKRKAGRKPSDAWDTFSRVLNPTAATTKRTYNGKCKHCNDIVTGKVGDLRKHAASCHKSNNKDKLAAKFQQIKAGGGGDSSSQVSIVSCADGHKLSST